MLRVARSFCTASSSAPHRANIGFIGVGTMGGPMALNVLKRHPGLVVFDLDKSLPVLDELRRAGASVASDIKDMGGCDQVVLCLPDSGAVEALLGIGEPKSGSASPSHLGHVLQRDCLVIDCSTTTPDTSKKAAAHLEALGAGGRFIDAPVTGEKRRAEDGTLTIMVGGDRRDYNAALPVLQSMSQGEPVFMGCNGNGQIAKAMNNCLYNISCAAMAEILTLAAKSGLDTAALSKVVSGGSGQSFGFDKFSGLVHERKFEAPQWGYPMESAFKDMQVVATIASSHGVKDDLGVIAAATSTYEEALKMGFQRQHKGAMTKVIEKKLGVTVQHNTNSELVIE